MNISLFLDVKLKQGLPCIRFFSYSLMLSSNSGK